MNTNQKLTLVTSLVVILVATTLTPAAASDTIDLELAAKYFGEAKTLSDEDGGKLWGKPLYGPLMFVEPKSHFVVANQQDAEGKLKERDGVFVGTLPKDETFGNTAKKWSGTHWTMVLWPLPSDEGARGELMMHELWHRIQNDIGLKPHGDVAQHLDTCDGRCWIQLEWKALRKALTSRDEKRVETLTDALVFRAYRRSLFEGAAETENGLELHEGLAAYTGTALAHKQRRARINSALDKLSYAPNSDSFVRSFAYTSGPAYGLILTDEIPGWCRKVKPTDDLGKMLATKMHIVLPDDLKSAAMSKGARYGGSGLYMVEEARAKKRQKQLEDYRFRFLKGPTLKLNLEKMNIMFDPNRVISMEKAGNVYENSKIIDSWGVLEASGGVLISDDKKYAIVCAPQKFKGSVILGDGYKLTLKPGWRVEPIGETRNYCLKKKED